MNKQQLAKHIEELRRHIGGRVRIPGRGERQIPGHGILREVRASGDCVVTPVPRHRQDEVLPPDQVKVWRAAAGLPGRVVAVALLLAALPATATAATQAQILAAIHRVESGGRQTAPRGDHGLARGPLQLHRDYWLDSRVPGDWSDCEKLDYSRRVVEAYMRRYEPRAWARGDAEIIARCHNGGPGWRRNTKSTDAYWRKVRKELNP